MAFAFGLKIQLLWDDNWCDVRVDCTEENLQADHDAGHTFRVKPNE